MKGLLVAMVVLGTILPPPVKLEPPAKVEAADEEKAGTEVQAEAVPPVVVPRKTPVELELLENLNSKLCRSGEVVRFRVAEDVVVDGQIVFATGTPVRGRIKLAEPSKSNGRAGTLQVVASKVRAVDGSEIRMFGEVVATGRQRSGAAAYASLCGGAAFLTMKGRQAYHFRGEIFEVLTRAEESIAASPDHEAVPAEDPPPILPAMAAGAPVTVSYNPNKGNLPPELSLEFKSEAGAGAPETVMIVQVDDLRLPEPIPARRISAKSSAWEAEFEPWPVIRHLEGSEAGRENRVRLHAVFRGTAPVSVEAAVILELKQK